MKGPRMMMIIVCRPGKAVIDRVWRPRTLDRMNTCVCLSALSGVIRAPTIDIVGILGIESFFQFLGSVEVKLFFGCRHRVPFLAQNLTDFACTHRLVL